MKFIFQAFVTFLYFLEIFVCKVCDSERIAQYYTECKDDKRNSKIFRSYSFSHFLLEKLHKSR